MRHLRFWMYSGLALLILSLALVAQAPAPPEKAGAVTSPAKILSQIDGLKAKVEAIRGLKYKSDFKKGLQSPADFQAFLKKEVDQEYPDKKLYAWKRWLVKFGFMEDAVDIKKLLLDLLQEQVVGYYDPERKQLYLIDRDLNDLLGGGGGKMSKDEEAALQMMKNMGFDMAGMLLSHELDHALEDQYFDLTKLKKQREDNEDRSNAVSALIEGESTLVMMEFIFKSLGLDASMFPQFGELLEGFSATAVPGMAKLDQAPEYFRENLLFPYLQGAKLAFALRKAGGWDLLNEAMRHPPESTEQVLHPEKYWPKRDNPVIISLPDLRPVLGGDWERLEENSLGELNISILGRKFLPNEAAAKLGPGWGGDTFDLFENKKTKDTLLVWYTTWDSVDEASRFYEGYQTLLERKYPKWGLPTREQGPVLGSLSPPSRTMTKKIVDRLLVLELKGPDVIFIEGVPEAQKDRVLERIWQSKKQPLAAPALSISK